MNRSRSRHVVDRRSSRSPIGRRYQDSYRGKRQYDQRSGDLHSNQDWKFSRRPREQSKYRERGYRGPNLRGRRSRSNSPKHNHYPNSPRQRQYSTRGGRGHPGDYFSVKGDRQRKPDQEGQQFWSRTNEDKKDQPRQEEEEKPQGKINVFMLEDPMYNYMQEKYRREKEDRIKQLQALLDSSSDSDASSASSTEKRSSHRKRSKRRKDDTKAKHKHRKKHAEEDSRQKRAESNDRTNKNEGKNKHKHKVKKKHKHKH